MLPALTWLCPCVRACVLLLLAAQSAQLPPLMPRDLIDLSNFPLLLIKFVSANFLQSVDSYRAPELGVRSAKLN